MANHVSSEGDRYIRLAVASGIYESESQALQQAVAILRKRDALRADVVAGIQQVDAGKVLPAEAVFYRLDARVRQIVSNATVQE